MRGEYRISTSRHGGGGASAEVPRFSRQGKGNKEPSRRFFRKATAVWQIHRSALYRNRHQLAVRHHARQQRFAATSSFPQCCKAAEKQVVDWNERKIQRRSSPSRFVTFEEGCEPSSEEVRFRHHTHNCIRPSSIRRVGAEKVVVTTTGYEVSGAEVIRSLFLCFDIRKGPGYSAPRSVHAGSPREPGRVVVNRPFFS